MSLQATDNTSIEVRLLKKNLFTILALSFLSAQVFAESLSYSGRLVNANGSPVTGEVDLIFDAAYSDDTNTIVCTQSIDDIALSNGVFHVELDFSSSCTISDVLANTPVNERLVIRVTDNTNTSSPKAYAFQSVHSVPKALVADKAANLLPLGASSDGDVLVWNSTSQAWEAGTVSGATGGTVTEVTAGSGLTASPNPITATGTISLSDLGTAGSYGNATTIPVITTDSKGRVSNVTNTAITGLAATAISDGSIDNTEFGALNGVSANIQTQLDSKEASLSSGAITQYYRGDKSWQTLDTSVVPENGNLYFLDSRVRNALLSGYSIGTAVPIAATDTLLEALQKLEGQIAANDSDISSINESQWTSNGSDIYYTSGNVGIGTSSPVDKLHLSEGNIFIHGSDSSSGHGLRLQYDSTAQSFWINPISDNTLGIGKTGGSAPTSGIININGGNGRVGIGTTSPSGILHLQHSADPDASFENTGDSSVERNTSLHFYHSNGRGAKIMASRDSGDSDGMSLKFSTQAVGGSLASRMIITQDGNIGVGTTAPITKLDVVQPGDITTTAIDPATGDAPYIVAKFQNSFTGTGETKAGISLVGGNGNNYAGAVSLVAIPENSANQRMGLGFYTTNGSPAGTTSEKVRVTSTGRLGVGTTAPSEKLEVSGNVKATAFIGDGSQLTGISSSSSSNTGDIVISADSDSDTNGEILFNTQGTTRAKITNQGSLEMGSTGAKISLGDDGQTTQLLRVQSDVATSDADAMTSFWANNSSFDKNVMNLRQDGTGNLLEMMSGSTSVVTFDNEGKLGLGADPEARLHIEESSGGTIVYPLILENSANTDGTGVGIQFKADPSYPGGEIYIHRDQQGGPLHSLRFKVNGSGGTDNVMTLKNNGNVGIGTVSPIGVLDIESSTPVIWVHDKELNPKDGSLLGAVRFSSQGGNAFASIEGIRHGTSNDDVTNFVIKTSHATGAGGDGINQERVRVSYNGNVGIGTTTPSARLHSFKQVDGVFTGLVVDNRKNYGGGTGTNEVSRIALSLSEDGVINPLARVMGYVEAGTENEGSSADGYIALGTRTSETESEKVRITSLGNVGIGTTTPTEKLEVAGNIKANAIIANGSHTIDSGTDGDAVLTLRSDTDDNNEGDNPFIHFKQDTDNVNGFIGMGGDTGDGFNRTITGSLANALLLNSENSSDSGVLQFATEDAVRMTINEDGEVGVGTNNPYGQLEISVAGKTSAASSLSDPFPLLHIEDTKDGVNRYASMRFHARSSNGGRTRWQIGARSGGNNIGEFLFTQATSGTEDTGLTFAKRVGIDDDGRLIAYENAQINKALTVNGGGSFQIDDDGESHSLLSVSKNYKSAGEKGDAILALHSGNGDLSTNHGRNAFIASQWSSANSYAANLAFYVRGDINYVYPRNPDGTAASGNIMSPKLFIEGHSGHVGIGTSDPTNLLTIEDDDMNTSAGLMVKSTDADSTAIISLSNDAKNWQFRLDGSSADKLYIYDATQAQARMTFDSSGRVGIGTGVPGEKLEVAGNIKINNNSTPEFIMRTGTNTLGPRISFQGSGNSTSAQIMADISNQDLVFKTNNPLSEKMRIKEDGKVGIGTSAPSEKLTVVGNIIASGSIRSDGGRKVMFIGSPGGSDRWVYLGEINDVAGSAGTGERGYTDIEIYDGKDFGNRGSGGTRLIASTRNNGISVHHENIGNIDHDNPNRSYFAIYDDGSQNYSLYLMQAAYSNTNIQINSHRTAEIQVVVQNPTGTQVYATNTPGTLRRSVGTLNASESIGIGTTTPIGKLHIYEDTDGIALFGIQNPNTGTSAKAAMAITHDPSSVDALFAQSIGDNYTPSGIFQPNHGVFGVTDGYDGLNIGTQGVGDSIKFFTANNQKAVLTSDGDLGIGTPSPSEKLHVVGNLRVQGSTDCTLGGGSGATNCTSDERLKDNIHEIDNALEKITSLRGVEFIWNELSLNPGQESIGVIAQDIQKVFPTAVIENADGYLSVDYAVLVAPLIGATKELAQNQQMYQLMKNGIDQKQDRKIASLENENKELKVELEETKRKYQELEARLKKIETKLGL